VIPPLWEYGGSGPTVHIAPANGFPPATYLPLFDGIMDRYRVTCIPPRALRPDAGAPPAAAGSWESLADDMVEGWEAHALAPVIAVGHSFGAVASMLAAIKARHLVRALVLLDPTIHTPKLMAQISAAKKAHGEVRFQLVDTAMRRRSTFESRESAFRYWRNRRFFSDWADEALWRYTDAMLRPAPEGQGFTLEWPAVWEAWYYRSFYPETWKDIPLLDPGIPLLIVGGADSDTYTADSAALVREALPAATHISVPGSGHLFPQSHPAETRAILEPWLAGLA
jgi:pimeloyl-ACP methyl ester carboxylesterase